MWYNGYMEKISVKLNKIKAKELQRLGLMFGLSIESLASKILDEVASNIGQESWSDYSTQSKTSFKRGLADFKAGRVSTSL